MLKLYVWLKDFLSSERGQDLIEYALLSGFIGVAFAVAAAAILIPGVFNGLVNDIAECVDMDSVCPTP